MTNHEWLIQKIQEARSPETINFSFFAIGFQNALSSPAVTYSNSISSLWNFIHHDLRLNASYGYAPTYWAIVLPSRVIIFDPTGTPLTTFSL